MSTAIELTEPQEFELAKLQAKSYLDAASEVLYRRRRMSDMPITNLYLSMGQSQQDRSDAIVFNNPPRIEYRMWQVNMQRDKYEGVIFGTGFVWVFTPLEGYHGNFKGEIIMTLSDTELKELRELMPKGVYDFILKFESQKALEQK